MAAENCPKPCEGCFKLDDCPQNAGACGRDTFTPPPPKPRQEVTRTVVQECDPCTEKR